MFLRARQMDWQAIAGWLWGTSAAVLTVYPLLVLAWSIRDGAASEGRSAVPADASGEACCGAPEKPARRSAWWPPATRRQVVEALLLSSAMVRYIVIGAIDVCRLLSFALLLAPWFMQIGYNYFHDPRIHRHIRVGSQSRNFVDVYVPAARSASDEKGTPVVVAVMGGAWLIGHRIWNAQLATRLADAGVLVVAVDYRNFPQAPLPEMLADVAGGIGWAMESAAAFGGDPGRIVVAAQSAGAHLSSLALVRRALAEASVVGGEKAENGGRTWSPADLKGYLGVSGVYDLPELYNHLQRRGACPSFLKSMCPGGDLAQASPTLALRAASSDLARAAAARMPPVHLFHGGDDWSVRPSSSLNFVGALQAAGHSRASAEVKPGGRHAEPVVEDPLSGDDVQVRMALRMLLGEEEGMARYLAMPAPSVQAPRLLVDLARRVMPF